MTFDFIQALILFDVLVLVLSIPAFVWAISLLVRQKLCWVKYIPIIALIGHTIVFYIYTLVERLTGAPLDNPSIIIWSSVLRLQGAITFVVLLYIFSLESSSNDRHTS
jgi:hypothetical protein